MQPDKTRIVIRERGYLDILDLALRVIHGHAVPLAATSALGALPFWLLNAWLLNGLAEAEVADGGLPALYLLLLASLVVWQMPWATSLTTLYLGQALFVERPDRRRMARDWLQALPQMALFQGLIRGICVPLVVSWFVLFTVWPCLNEIILLERNPLRPRAKGGASTFSRSWSLHSRNTPELVLRWVVSVFVGPLLVASLAMSLYVLRGIMANYWEFDASFYVYYLPVAVWVVVSYFAVARFLSYLDLRIRNEGWEVELKMLGEAGRLTRQFA